MTASCIRILIAEDQAFIALEAERILVSACNCEVLTCHRSQMTDLLGQHRFDLVVLERGNDPGAFAVQARVALGSGADVAVLCASGEGADVSSGLLLAGVIEKPFDEQQVSAFIAQYCLSRLRSGCC